MTSSLRIIFHKMKKQLDFSLYNSVRYTSIAPDLCASPTLVLPARNKSRIIVEVCKSKLFAAFELKLDIHYTISGS